MRVTRTLKRFHDETFGLQQHWKRTFQGVGKELTRGCSCSSLLVTICTPARYSPSRHIIRLGEGKQTELKPFFSKSNLFFLWCHATNCLSSFLSSPEGAGLARGGLCFAGTNTLWNFVSALASSLLPAPWGERGSKRSEEPKSSFYRKKAEGEMQVPTLRGIQEIIFKSSL